MPMFASYPGTHSISNNDISYLVLTKNISEDILPQFPTWLQLLAMNNQEVTRFSSLFTENHVSKVNLKCPSVKVYISPIRYTVPAKNVSTHLSCCLHCWTPLCIWGLIPWIFLENCLYLKCLSPVSLLCLLFPPNDLHVITASCSDVEKSRRNTFVRRTLCHCPTSVLLL